VLQNWPSYPTLAGDATGQWRDQWNALTDCPTLWYFTRSVVGSLVMVLLHIISWLWQWNNFDNRLIFDEVKAYKKLHIFGPPCIAAIEMILSVGLLESHSLIASFLCISRQHFYQQVHCWSLCNRTAFCLAKWASYFLSYKHKMQTAYHSCIVLHFQHHICFFLQK